MHRLLPAVLGLALASSPHTASTAEGPPNIVIYFVDDLGYGDLSCYGSRTVTTPNLDRMASEGLRCTDFYVSAPVCTSSRASLITGLTPERVGLTGALTHKSKKGLHEDYDTIGEVCRSRGYATAMIGKWHLGHQPSFLPIEHGFDLFFGIPYSHNMPLADDLLLSTGVTRGRVKGGGNAPLMHQGEVIEAPPDYTQMTKRYTEEALRFIDANSKRPFLLYIAPNMPHSPVSSSERFAGKSKEGPYADAVLELDWSVGEILLGLKKAKLDRRTMVFFASDNGPDESGGSAGPLRGGKHTLWEGGIRVPAIFWWPGGIPPGETAQILSTLDIMPTLASIVGALPPKTDGIDITPALTGRERGAQLRDGLAWRGRAARSGPWKLVIEGDRPHLYDLSRDIGELVDLAGSEPAQVAKLQALVKANR